MEELPSPFEVAARRRPEKKPDGKKPALKTTIQRKYTPTVDALKTGRSFDGREALMHILYEKTDTIFDYAPDAVIVMDQPDRLRERCENRLLEFEEYFKAAMERDEAIPEQAELLLRWDYLLTQTDGRDVMVVEPFLRQQNDFIYKDLVKLEGRGATGYSGNMKELARDIAAWKKDGWRVALMAGGVARGAAAGAFADGRGRGRSVP